MFKKKIEGDFKLTTSEIAIMSAIMASVSAGAAVLSVFLSAKAFIRAGKAQAANKDMFKRQGVIDLHMAWQGVNAIDTADTDKIIAKDVEKASNALSLTATLWNHDIIDKQILYQLHWDDYKELYETLNGSSKIVDGYNKRCKDFISSYMSKAYEGMKTEYLNSVKQTNIGE